MPGYAVVDVETTGLHPGADRVVQVAITQVSPSGQVQREWASLVNPQRDPGPVHVHGLSSALLASAPLYAQVAPTVADLLADRVLVAHNVDFDWHFLRTEQRRAGFPLATRQRLCTMDLSRRLRIPVKDLRLSTLAAHWDVEQRRAHDAVDDTRVLVEVFQASLALAAERQAGLPLIPCTGLAGQWQTLVRSSATYPVRRRYYRVRGRYRRFRRRVRRRWREFRQRHRPGQSA